MDSAQKRLLAAGTVATLLLREQTRGKSFDLERWAQDTFVDHPFSKLASLVALGAVLFYRAETGKNPKCKSYMDALVYVSTCASVGYGDIFAQTPVGKAVGSLMMTVGPAMANAAFVGHSRVRESERVEALAVQQQILSTLQEILARLPAQG
jgi:H+/gluconate symporter-like permease